MSKDRTIAQRLDELFDVVNERDQVVGTAPRGEVHRLGLLHRAVHVVVVNARGEVFLQKRSLKKDMSPGRWDSSCSGHVDSGEGYEAAAVRELGEEIGLRGVPVTEVKEWFRVGARKETGWEFMRVYGLRHEGPFELHPAEIDEGRWWLPREISTAVAETPECFTKPFRFMWPRMLEALAV